MMDIQDLMNYPTTINKLLQNTLIKENKCKKTKTMRHIYRIIKQVFIKYKR